MAIRVKHRVWVHTFADSDETVAKHEPDPEKSEVITDEVQKQTHYDLSIAASSTQSLGFGDIDNVKGMLLVVQAACKVRLNGSADSIDMAPVKGAAGALSTTPAKLFLEAAITQVDVQNEDGTNALVGEVVFWGDETA